MWVQLTTCPELAKDLIVILESKYFI
jgi:hypothetical protein